MTLRATAREAGIAAPSIYPHFANREEMLEAVLEGAFQEFAERQYAAMAGLTDPVERLRACCLAYIRFGHEHPATYAIIFTRPHPSEMPAVGEMGRDALGVLIGLIEDCVAAGRSRSKDPRADAVGLWLGLHGAAALPPSHPRFPWPESDRMVDWLVEGLARVE